MSRKDYVAIAAVIARSMDNPDDGPLVSVKAITDELCAMFKRDNPNFDRQRFLSACGL